MNIVAYILFALYLICLLYILVYSIFQLQLLLIYIFKKKNYTKLELSSSELPMVTIQLPVFNEKYVVNRIIDQIALFNYPKEKLQIQVLDDSTDETLDLSIAQVEKYKNQGFDIELLHIFAGASQVLIILPLANAKEILLTIFLFFFN